jgi:membrane-bound lytic murein transglycosylase B
MFTRELLALMRIIENGDMAYEDLIGSWAGAIGHMQFMPSTFLSYAVDADGDGRKNLIGSVDDALLSGATYLANAGWQPGFRWGREVMLPDNFDYALAGLDQQRALSDWRAMGVNDVFGRPIPAISLQASLLVPSGHTGPAFLVYPNFHVIMEWNRSQYYALSVGRLADRIAGAGRLHQPLPDIALSTQALTQLQAGLNELGYAAGTPDGVLGPSTRKAIRAFQQANGLLADGFPNDMLMQSVSLQRRGKINE